MSETKEEYWEWEKQEEGGVKRRKGEKTVTIATTLRDLLLVVAAVLAVEILSAAIRAAL